MMDIEPLLAPVSDNAPCGEDLSFSLEFDSIQEARRADDPSLDQGAWITDLKTADWQGVTRQCSELLRSRTKDLRLAVWLAEAQTKLHGLAGLAAGYQLAAELCDRYWDGVYPEVEGGDMEQRVGNIAWLLTQSIQWARRIPLVEEAHGRYNLIDFEGARARPSGGVTEHSNQPSMDQVDAAKAGTSYEFYLRLAEDAPLARQALQALERAVDARLAQDGPSFSATRDALDNVIDTALRFARDAGVHVDGEPQRPLPPPIPTGGAAAPSNNGGATYAPPAMQVAPGEIASRKEAIAQLRRVAEFFRRTEPHSPVAYLADKAARWGSMPLHVWLKNVVKDDALLSQLEEMLDVGSNEENRQE